MSPFVVAEIDVMVVKKFGADGEVDFLDDVLVGRWTLAPWSDDDMSAAVAIVKQYGNVNIGIADASNVVLAPRYKTNRILTLDCRHFRKVTAINGDAFTLLPVDETVTSRTGADDPPRSR